MNEQEFAELSAGAALHALSPDDERRFRAALAVHPEWRSVARHDADAAAALASVVEPVSPPDGIRSALLARIAETPQTDGESPTADGEAPRGSVRPIPKDDDRDAGAGTLSTSGVAEPAAPSPSSSDIDSAPAGSRRGRRLLFVLAACIVLLVGIGVGTVVVNGILDRPAPVVALEQIEGSDDAQQASVSLDGGGTAIAHWSASLGRAVLVTEDIAAPADGHTYELWFVRGDGAVSAGTFSVEGGHAIAELKGEMRPGDAIAVTVEPDGGSPTGRPSSDPFIVIPTA
ncbi:anti-sigma factor domain-containing protein [Microbacterium sp. ZW T6_19]|uniref:anti-sigma factor n=1 Tax=Microbacterium sp. ZW T6_19 TaxID=3378082 RepID=UPI003852F485